VQKTLKEALNPPDYKPTEADKKTLATVAQVKELEARIRRLEANGVGGKTNNITNNICVYQISPNNLLNLAFMTTPTFMQRYLGQEPGEGLTLMETPGVPEFQQAMQNALEMAAEKAPIRMDAPKITQKMVVGTRAAEEAALEMRAQARKAALESKPATA
jgi:hypothetical protein